MEFQQAVFKVDLHPFGKVHIFLRLEFDKAWWRVSHGPREEA